MLLIKSSESQKRRTISYPCLMENKVLNVILLAVRETSTDTFEGMIIKSLNDIGFRFGEYSKTWNKGEFSEYVGKVELIND